jgi:hypothetical protein
MKSIKVIPKKRRRGRPATGRDPVLALRISDDLREKVDRWAASRKMTRSKAIRALIDKGLKE